MYKQYLWTPWRMAYVSGKEDEGAGSQGANETAPQEIGPMPEEVPPQESIGCVFCDRIRLSPDHDRSNLILLRGERNFVILNLYPYNSAHLMLVPYEHTADFAGLDRETVAEMMDLAQRMLAAIKEEYAPEGFNLGMNLGRIAGAGVADHVHMHVVPRWGGDTNFMPVVGATKVMPELLETTYDRLKRRLET
ncbi:MAG: HIT domain-containing protein [Chloroflexota bacterium]|nr:HIT domain-containing protein [Chloroflexota bacterium]